MGHMSKLLDQRPNAVVNMIYSVKSGLDGSHTLRNLSQGEYTKTTAVATSLHSKARTSNVLGLPTFPGVQNVDGHSSFSTAVQ